MTRSAQPFWRCVLAILMIASLSVAPAWGLGEMDRQCGTAACHSDPGGAAESDCCSMQAASDKPCSDSDSQPSEGCCGDCHLCPVHHPVLASHFAVYRMSADVTRGEPVGPLSCHAVKHTSKLLRPPCC